MIMIPSEDGMKKQEAKEEIEKCNGIFKLN